MNKNVIPVIALATVALGGCSLAGGPTEAAEAPAQALATGQDYLDINCPVNVAAKEYRQVFRAYDKDGYGYRSARPSLATATAAANLQRAYADAAQKTMQMQWPTEVQPVMEEQATRKYTSAAVYGEIARQQKWINVTPLPQYETDVNSRARLLLGLDPAGDDCPPYFNGTSGA